MTGDNCDCVDNYRFNSLNKTCIICENIRCKTCSDNSNKCGTNFNFFLSFKVYKIKIYNYS